MNLKQYLTLMVMGTVLCWSMFLLVVFNIEPAAGNMPFIFFYASLLLSIIGSFSIVGLLIRVMLFRKKIVFREVKNSFRQAFLFSLLVIISLFLQSKDILTFLNIIFLIIALAVMESLLVLKIRSK